jgi:hypothetical protein
MAVDIGGRAVRFNGTSWGAPVSIDGANAGLTDVSCPSASFCMAVDTTGHAIVFNGSSWGSGVAFEPSDRIVRSVSCASSLFCVVTDSIGDIITYKPPSQRLTVTKAGTGSGVVTSSPAGISCGSTCAHTFAKGTAVTLAATSASGSVFTGWSGGGCSGTGTCHVTLDSDTTVNATFARIYRPDALIRRSTDSVFTGGDVYSATAVGESLTTIAGTGSKAVFYVRAQNDGTTNQVLTLSGPGNVTGFRVHYFAGSTDITSQVEAGTYQTASLAPGSVSTVQVAVSVTSAATTGTVHGWLVSVTSHGITDAVLARVKVG